MLDERVGVAEALDDDALRLVVVEVGVVLQRAGVLGADDLHALRGQALELFDVAVVEPEPDDGLKLGRSHAHSPSIRAAPSAALTQGRSRGDVLDTDGEKQPTRPTPATSSVPLASETLSSTRQPPSPNTGSGQAFEEAESVVDCDLGPVDVSEHKRDPSGPAVYIDHRHATARPDAPRGRAQRGHRWLLRRPSVPR